MTLETVLWNCRVALRGIGSLEKNRDAVIGLVFMKFAGDKLLLLAVFVLALPKTFAKTCSHVLPHNGLKFGTSQDAKL